MTVPLSQTSGATSLGSQTLLILASNSERAQVSARSRKLGPIYRGEEAKRPQLSINHPEETKKSMNFMLVFWCKAREEFDLKNWLLRMEVSS